MVPSSALATDREAAPIWPIDIYLERLPGAITVLEDLIEEYVEEETTKDPRKHYVLIKGAKGVKHKHISTTAKAVARVAQINNMAWAIMEAQ